MELEDKINLFSVSAILLFGAVLGGFLTYQHMDARIESLEQSFNDSRTVVYVNSSSSRFRDFSGLYDSVDQSVVSVTSRGSSDVQGSGFVYSSNGYVVTNEHVVDDASEIMVTFTDGKTYRAEVVGKDPNNDLAVLKVDRKGLDPLELGNLSEVSIGDPAVAIGNPFGLSSSITAGIISQKGRQLPTGTGFSIPNVIQTDAAVNPGNSGGPLLNTRGEVVGVNTAIESRTGTFSGIGFAIPVNIVKNVVPEMIKGDWDFEDPWIGVSGFDVSPGIADAMNLSQARGFLVVDVVNGSPAEKAGFQGSNITAEVKGIERRIGGDVIVGIEGRDMGGIGDIQLYLQSRARVNETVNITVIRDGERVVLPTTLGSREEANSVRSGE